MSEEEIRLDQTKKVFDTLAELISKNKTCTYRYLIYDLLGFDAENYAELMSGLTITNALVEKEEQQEEIDRLNNIIYTTLEYVDREEVNSIGIPYTYTEIGKNIKELLEGERTFNSIWEENKRLNNIINELERHLHQEILEWQDNNDNWIKAQVQEDKVILDKLKELKEDNK